MTEKPVLYDNAFSPYAFKVRATLYEKGIDHEKREMRYASQRKELLEINPRGEVPALTHAGMSIYDSNLICEYLESTFPEPSLLPQSAPERARCRSLERTFDGALDGCIVVLALVKLIRPKLQALEPEVAAAATRHLREIHRMLDEQLQDREWLCGSFSRADISLSPHIAGGAFLGAPPAGANLAAWHERASARPALQRAAAEFVQAYQTSRLDDDPFFSRERLYLRDHRLEWCFRLGLGSWLVSETEAGRVGFPELPTSQKR